ncbi:MAG TPA: hypothetical protein VG456_17920 [Candidatus Sulfopaludibacter sp.]|nr:hypothetical protein [Candidatus Sulfopaludibacter sp.]
MLAQFPKDLVHFEGRQDRLDEHRGADGAGRNPQLLLRPDEDLIPQTSLHVALQFRQVEIRPRTVLDERARVVEEEQAEVEERGGNRTAVHQEVLLLQVPTPGPHHENRGTLAHSVLLAFRTGISDDAAHRVAQVGLALDHVLPGGRVGVFEVGHENAGAGIQRVDDHLAIHRTGDLHAAIHQVGWNGRGLPVALADVRGLRQKVRHDAGVELLLPDAARLQ